MKVAINQSNYIPWKGYFDMIRSVDLYVLYDDVQYTRRDWRNRNQIKGVDGLKWLTIPVKVKGRYHQKIRETIICNTKWTVKHLNLLKQFYATSSHFKDVFPLVEHLYETAVGHKNISEINYHFIKAICNYLDIETKIVFSHNYDLSEQKKTERLVDICQQANATEYISGPAAKDYLMKDKFDNANIKVTWMDYNHYPEYPQLYGTFVHKVSILDLLFNCGEKSMEYIGN